MELLITAPTIETDSDVTVVHRQFHTIVTLLTLVSAINNGDQPRFPIEGERFPSALDESLHLHDWVLNAITTLLVLNYQNVASAANNSYKALAHQLVSVDQEADSDDESEYQESESTILPPNAPAPQTPSTMTTTHLATIYTSL